MAPSPGRPPTPLDPDASCTAYLGSEVRRRRLERGWTLEELAERTSYSIQHISEVERAKTWPSAPFVAACDSALEARGRLLDLLPAVDNERAEQRRERAIARRSGGSTALPCETTDSEPGDDEDLEPTDRRGLIRAGTAAALGAAGVAASPAAAREVDPELPEHSRQLLSVIRRHDAMHGPHDVLDLVQRELCRITGHREVARGELRRDLMRVESCYAAQAAWLSEDAGQRARRNGWTDRALRLAKEADDPDMVAFVRLRQSQWAAHENDARRAIAYADNALNIPGSSEQARARGALRAALGHALAGHTTACERSLADAYARVQSSPATPSSTVAIDEHYVRSAEARCWLWMRPSRAVPLYERALREWPRDHRRYGGIHQARLALACAASGELDRARAEGGKAVAIFKTTQSATAARELRQLRETLAAA